ncbi:MAG: hypothetical protein Kow0080_31870 [Candidatus Promineifilaceae bacterium]
MTYRKPLVLIFIALSIILVATLLPSSAMVDRSGIEAAQRLVVNAQPEAPAAPAATTNTIALTVTSARDEPFWGAPLGDPNPPGILKGDPITEYKFIINVDDSGLTDEAYRYPDCSPFLNDGSVNPTYPESCPWVSIASLPSSSPIVTQGDQTELNNAGATLTLPDGKYLISVISNDFKIDGQWFELPMEEDPNNPGVASISVQLQPFPLPTSTIRVKVFNDNALPNSAADIPAEAITTDTPVEQGMAGFEGHIGDWLGEVTNDIFGNPLCTEYEPGTGPYGYNWVDGAPVPIPGTGGKCLSNTQGDIVIPNVSTNRYETWVVPPDGEGWTQTTTLEGNKPWDTWTIEGWDGYDSEFVIAGEPFPFVIFGFVRPTNLLTDTTYTGIVKGTVAAAEVYIPFTGGLDYQGHLWGGLAGSKIREPIANPWVALSDLQGGDTAVWIGQGDENGNFEIPNVPPGDYLLTYWDGPQMNLLDLTQITVGPGTNGTGETVDMGVMFVTGWFTKVWGTVFDDANGNGYRDQGEPGIKDFPLIFRRRENSEMDRGAIAVATDTESCTPANIDAGNCFMFENTYPYNNWLVLEFFSPNYVTTGYTYQTFNMTNQSTHPLDTQPNLPGVTILGNGVDIGVMPLIGQSVMIDIGVRPYAEGENGGIAGTVFYDQTRTWYEAQKEAPEPWGVGIPDLEMNLYAPVPDPANPGAYLLDADGSYLRGQLLATTTTERWQRPKGCYSYDVDGNRTDNQNSAILPNGDLGVGCLETLSMGTLVENDFSTVDGNYGFSDIMYDAVGNLLPEDQWTPLPPGDYLVEVVIPNDPIQNKPLYQVAREEDINIFTGNQYIPQPLPLEVVNGSEVPDRSNPPDTPICAGALHTVDVAGVGTDGYPADSTSIPGVTIAASTPVINPDFAEDGGSPYEGMARHLCDMKLVQVISGRAVAPSFTFFTEVPIPGRWWGLILDDLTLSTNPAEWTFGEKAGIPNVPIGVYDFTNRLVTTIESDPNGMFSALMPSTLTMNSPSPTGMSANMFRLVGNDPGQPGRLNANYNPQYRTISANFEVIPGVSVIADLAPFQVATSIQSPGSQFNHVALCKLDAATPQLYAVDTPYVYTLGTDAQRTINIMGTGFGATQGTGTVSLMLNTTEIPLQVTSWSDRQITAVVPYRTRSDAYQLNIVADNGEHMVNALTIHVLGRGYNPTLFEVGPGKAYDPWVVNPSTGVNYTIQDALNDAVNTPQALVIVYNKSNPLDPNTQEMWNPKGVYYENLVMHSPVKLQGVGPGGFYENPDGTTQYVLGSIINGLAFAGDTGNARNWRQLVHSLNILGNQTIYEGAVVTVYATQERPFLDHRFFPSIDGFTIEGGDQQDFPNNINQIGGGNNGQQAQIIIQGGGIYVNGHANYLRITNNIIQNNGGAYGAIRFGTPNLAPGDPNKDAQNDNIKVMHNQILANGGTNLAGAIGIFDGTERYEIAYNDLCGNYSAEYGGAISHYGYSPQGSIHNNRVYFNHSMDEGGGIMIAGELPRNSATTLSPGAGPVDIYNNIIQANLSNDDGGGLRFLMAGNYNYRVYNNMFLNNVSTHEGGGVSLNDAPRVFFYNNTVAKNLTTATAVTSNGQPAPAGLSTSRNSALLQASLPRWMPDYSDPVLFNNIFWDNRAGTWDGNTVSGIGLEGDTSPLFHWDMGVSDLTYLLSPTYTLMQTDRGTVPDPNGTNLIDDGTGSADPQIIQTYDTTISVLPWRTNPNFVGVLMVAVDLPPTMMGDYHIMDTSPAVNMGTDMVDPVGLPITFAPVSDIDGDIRPSNNGYEIGADETGELSMVLAIPGSAQYMGFHQQFLPFVGQE